MLTSLAPYVSVEVFIAVQCMMVGVYEMVGCGVVMVMVMYTAMYICILFRMRELGA